MFDLDIFLQASQTKYQKHFHYKDDEDTTSKNIVELIHGWPLQDYIYTQLYLNILITDNAFKHFYAWILIITIIALIAFISKLSVVHHKKQQP